MRFLVRFAEIQVENGLTWFLICFLKKKNETWTYVFFFLCNFALEEINLEKCLRVNFEQSRQYF